jgi:ferric-dicitrate binding protein FerR (iron transport regulator)
MKEKSSGDAATERVAAEVTDDQRCRVAGTLVERAYPEVDLALTADARARLQEAWVGQGPAPARGRRRLVVSTVGALALVAVAAIGLHERPLRFDVQGGRIDPGGAIATAGDGSATLAFSDGTRVVLAGATAARVAARDARGAQVVIEQGHARFDVVHRAHTRWRVAAGPFEIAVTGTSFDVDWPAASRHTLVVDLHVGSVVVRGSLAGEGLSLRAGQRLVADLDRGALSVVEPGTTRDVPVAAPAAAEEDERALETPSPTTDSTEAAASSAPRAGDDREPSAARPRATRAQVAAAARAIDSVGMPSVTQPPRFDGPAPAWRAPARDFEPPPLEPAPAPPSLQIGSKLAAGGSACLDTAPQIRFDRAVEGVALESAYALAFTHPALDRGRSWCGAGSLRVDARFDLAGAPNRFGDRPRHAGEVLVDLPSSIDLTGKTVIVHVFVEGPSDLRFGAQIFAVNSPPSGGRTREATWVGGGYTPDLTTGRWWTLSHRFERENHLFEGGTSVVDRVERLAVQVYAIGKDRIWTGRVFVDDIGWQ